MNNRRTIIIRSLILVTVLMTVLGIGVGIHLHRQRERDQQAMESKARGEQALRDGEYEAALVSLGRYLKRFPEDTEALYSFAKARMEVEQEDGKHLLVAMHLLARLRFLRPEFTQAKQELLQLYLDFEMWPETLDLANDLIEKNRNNSAAKWSEVLALEQIGDPQVALAAAKRYTDLEPDDLKGQLKRTGLMRASEIPDAEIIAYVRTVRARDEFNPTYRLLLAHTLAFTGAAGEAKPMLLSLAGLEQPDELHDKILILSLNRLGLRDEARGAMVRASRGNPISHFHESLINAEWQRANYGKVVARIQQIEDKGHSPGVDLSTLKIVALVHQGLMDEARSELARLEPELSSPSGQVWLRFLRDVLLSEDSSVAQRILDCESAARLEPSTPYFPFTLARLYEEVGENILAAEAYAETYRLAPNWPEPLLRAARLMAATGGVREAVELTTAARRMRPEDPEVQEVWSLVRDYFAPTGNRESLTKLSDRLAKISSDDDLLLPLRVSTEVRLGNRRNAKRIMREVLRKQPPPSAQLLLQLARQSDRLELGLSKDCLDALIGTYGVTPTVAFYQARHALRETGAEYAAEVFEELRKSGEDPTDISWDAAIATLLDAADPERALAAWRVVSVSETAGILALRHLIDSKSAWLDSALISDAIQRIRSITGDSGITWRLARANQLLTSENFDEEQAKEVLVHLTHTLSRAPHLAHLRPVLATAYRRLGDREGAIEQLLQSANLGKFQSQIDIELATLAFEAGRYAETSEKLEVMVEHQQPGVHELVRAADLLLRVSDVELAEKVLTAEDVDWGQLDRKRKAILVRVLAVRHRFAEAAELLDGLLSTPEPELLRFAADLAMIRGDDAAATAYLDRLDELDIHPVERESLKAEHHRRFGRLDRALLHCKAAVTVSPKKRRLWLRYLSTLILAERGADLAAVMQEATVALPEDPWLQQLTDQAEVLAACADDDHLRSVAAEWVENPALDAAAHTALKLLTEFRKKGAKDKRLALEIGTLSANTPAFFELHMLAMRLFTEIEQWDRVLEVAKRTRLIYPTRDAPSRIASTVLFNAGQPEQALQAAKEWLRRSRSENLDARLIIADCHLQLGKPLEAIRLLEGHLDRALASPRQYHDLLTIYATALVEAKQEDQVEEIILPLLDEHEALRAVWLRLCAAQLDNSELAIRWLLAAEERMKKPSVDSLLMLSTAWGGLAEKTEGSRSVPLAGLLRALETLEPRDDLTAEQWFTVGSWREWLREPGPAKQHYRKVLELAPEHAAAKNNLALILLAEGEGDEARRLLRSATESNPENVELLDSLASVLVASEDWEDALQQIQVCRELDGENPRWPITQLEIHGAADTAPESPVIVQLFSDLDLKYERPFRPDLWKRYRALQKRFGVQKQFERK